MSHGVGLFRALLTTAIGIAVFGCGGGDSGPSNYWQGIIRNTTNLSSGATLHTCAEKFTNQAACIQRQAADACFASYPFKPVPSNAVYMCVFVTE